MLSVGDHTLLAQFSEQGLGHASGLTPSLCYFQAHEQVSSLASLSSTIKSRSYLLYMVVVMIKQNNAHNYPGIQGKPQSQVFMALFSPLGLLPKAQPKWEKPEHQDPTLHLFEKNQLHNEVTINSFKKTIYKYLGFSHHTRSLGHKKCKIFS